MNFIQLEWPSFFVLKKGFLLLIKIFYKRKGVPKDDKIKKNSK